MRVNVGGSRANIEPLNDTLNKPTPRKNRPISLKCPLLFGRAKRGEFGHPYILPATYQRVGSQLLDPHHARVHAVGRDQLVVGSGLGDTAPIQDDDSISVSHGGEAVRDDQGSSVMHQPEYGLLDKQLRVCVHRRGGLIKDQDGGILEHCPGD